jgi:methyl-galactoside transport system substrate-binding protein
MKKHRNKKKCDRKIVSAACMALACILLSGCRAGAASEKKHAIRIGVSLYRADDTFIGNIRSELEKRAKEYEQETGIKVTLDIQDAKGNQYVQNKQVERFISLGCDTLCVNPVDRTTSSGIIDAAAAADIPVVFFNRQPVEEDMDRWDRLYYVGADAKESAVLEAEIVADQYEKDPASLDKNGDGVISYVLLEGESNHQDSLIRTEWSVQTLKDRGVPIEKITGGIANWERSQASALMEQWLELYPDTIELVLSNNDDMAMAAARAAKGNAAYAKTIFVGFDGIQSACNAILAGEETMSVAQEAYDMGYKAVEAAVKAVNGETLEKFIDSGCSVVTKDNAQERLDKLKGYIG